MGSIRSHRYRGCGTGRAAWSVWLAAIVVNLPALAAPAIPPAVNLRHPPVTNCRSGRAPLDIRGRTTALDLSWRMARGDCNGNGIPDECDLTCANGCADHTGCGQSIDCQPDGIPDECQLLDNDCNRNGVPDDCDIATGFSEDIDANGVPDDCEDCNGNGIPDGCDVLCADDCKTIPGCGESADCDGNGIPDECDILTHDCNGNGIPDACDVPPLGGYSPDCNEDLVPDECQLSGNDCNDNDVPDECDLGGPAVPTYALDDGSSENGIGISNGGTLIWLNRFVVEPNGQALKALRVAYRNIPAGERVTVCIWSDPDGDGTPADAQLLATTFDVVDNPNTDTFNHVPVSSSAGDGVHVGEVGTSFFVGVIVDHPAGQFPAPLDQDSDAGDSWLAAGPAVDPNDLSSASLYGRTGELGIGGNWLVRAVSAAPAPPNDCDNNGVPDECDIDHGTSTDCNSNGIPDECDVPPLGDYSLDCNGNLIPDECELADQDCDNNGIPDDCQPEDDCDDNGLLDICELDYSSGLVGQYWRSIAGDGNYSQRLAVRVDPVVDFNWGGGAPHPDLPADNFAVRWTGLLVTPPASGEYVFFVASDDGVSLWLNDELLIDEWHDYWAYEYSASIQLLGSHVYHIRLDYYEGTGNARISLKWITPDGVLETVPSEHLYPGQDCDGNTIPDFCDLGGASLPDYTLDDSAAENTVGLISAADVAWLNHFVVEPNGESLEAVRVAYGTVSPGTPVTAYIWTDPNGDGVPDDAEVLASVATSVQHPNTNRLNRVEFAPTYIGPPGTSFFVGALIHHQVGELPAALDQSTYQGASWMAGDTTNVDPNDLAAAELFGSTGSIGAAGNWLVRAVPLVVPLPGDGNANGVPDECEDCNDNGVLDELDVANGTSADCNTNGLPDECETASEPLNDCNENGVPDECELDEFDCDQNGIHDACQAILNGLVAEYFDNPDFDDASIIRIDSAIDFNWANGAPALGIPNDYFSARWTGALLTRASGTYHFRADRDDGFRLFLNGRLLFDDGNGASINLPENTLVHLRGEFWEGAGDARVTLYWTPPGEGEAVVPGEHLYPLYDADWNGIPDTCEYGDCNSNGLPDPLDIAVGIALDCDGNDIPDDCQGHCDCDGNGLLDTCEAAYTEGLVGQYFTSYGGGGNFSSRVLIRVDPTINFNWGHNSPDPLLPTDNYTVRWTGRVTTTAAAGSYVFYTYTDDGARLWVNDELIIDQWQPQGPTEHSATISLAANTAYLIRMEYREDGGSALAALQWMPPGGSKEIIPANALGPMADADGDSVPDGCPVFDCNQNGIPDLEEIVLGYSADCNTNCVPDACDIMPTPFDYGQGHWRFEESGGAIILHAGPDGPNGTLNALPFRSTDVPVDPIPQSGLANSRSLDLNWQSTNSGGFGTVPDTDDGALSMGDHDFTIEAWVKLDYLSSTADSHERQFLCQKKWLISQDTTLDYAFLVQRGDNAAGTTYGKTSDFSGRELQVYFGTGTSTWNVTSHLELSDYEWHFVSMAYNAAENTVRFGLDDQFETVSFEQQPRYTNAGPLRIGSHQNGQGVDNFFLRGMLDELRITRRVVPTSELLNVTASSYSDDANGNGIPDECEEAVAGDLDHDGDVDHNDFAIFADCLAGPEVARHDTCTHADLDADLDVDLADFATFCQLFGNHSGQ